MKSWHRVIGLMLVMALAVVLWGLFGNTEETAVYGELRALVVVESDGVRQRLRPWTVDPFPLWLLGLVAAQET